MHKLTTFGLALAIGALAQPAFAQKQKKSSEEDYVTEKPAVGDPFPDLTVYSPDGKEFRTSGLKGQYTVITFGCLT